MTQSQKKILLVEDDDFLVRALTKKFEPTKYEFFHSGNGKSGLKKALEAKPDLILTDIMMPEMDGIEMVKKIRKEDWGKRVPVIFITNMGFPGRSGEAFSLNAEYMVKSSVHLSKIIEKIKSKLKT